MMHLLLLLVQFLVEVEACCLGFQAIHDFLAVFKVEVLRELLVVIVRGEYTLQGQEIILILASHLYLL